MTCESVDAWALRQIEWSGKAPRTPDRYCPGCQRTREQGHVEDCVVGNTVSLHKGSVANPHGHGMRGPCPECKGVGLAYRPNEGKTYLDLVICPVCAPAPQG